MKNTPDLSRVIADNQRAALRMLVHFDRCNGLGAQVKAIRREVKQNPDALRIAGDLVMPLFDYKPAFLAEAKAKALAKVPALASLVIDWFGFYSQGGRVKGSLVSETPTIPSLFSFASLASAGEVWANGQTNAGAVEFDELSAITPLQTRFGGWWEDRIGFGCALVSPRRARALALRTYGGNRCGTTV